MDNNEKNPIKKQATALVIGTAIMIGSLGWGFTNQSKGAEALEYAQKTYLNKSTATDKKVNEILDEPIVVNKYGKSDEALSAIDAHMTKAFELMTTFTDGKSYMDNRRQAMALIDDKKFFKTFMPEDKDKLGASHIDTLSLKSAFDSLQLYPTEKNDEYYIIVGNIPYHKAETIKNRKILTSDYGAFKATIHYDKDEERVTVPKIESINRNFMLVHDEDKN